MGWEKLWGTADEPRLSQRTILRSISALALGLRGCSIYSTAHIGVSISINWGMFLRLNLATLVMKLVVIV